MLVLTVNAIPIPISLSLTKISELGFGGGSEFAREEKVYRTANPLLKYLCIDREINGLEILSSQNHFLFY